MQSAFIAALAATLTLAFVESLGRLYPSRATWRRLRRARGREAMLRMRERFEASASRRTTRWLTVFLVVLVGVWIAVASLLDKRWHEVVLDVVPYVLVGVALIRTPAAMRAVAERMKAYEHEFGDDDRGREPGGDVGEIAL